MECLSVISFVLLFGQSLQAEYEIFFEDQAVYSNCRNQPINVIGMEEVFDISDIVTEMNDDIVSVSGNATIRSIWNIDPSDRIELHINLYHWEIGMWQPTIYNLVYKDVCLSMWEKTTYIYTFFTQHIINVDEIKEKCMKVPGTTIYFEDWDVRMVLNFNGPTLHGRFKMEQILMAFDNSGKKRPMHVCYQATLELRKRKS